MSETSGVDGPLADIRVLDLAGEAGAFAGRLLADLGADVIRIEPVAGDAVRRRGPFLDGVEGPELSLYHLHFNANKRDITLDVRSPEGSAIFRLLAAVSDALIETAAPGQMDSLGIGYEALSSANPALLYATITPFGQEGPMRDYRGNDLIGAAMSGLMYLNGQPEDPPNQPGAEQAYHMASLAAASGILIALYGRGHDPAGHGRRIDVSVQEAAAMATLQTANANSYTWYKRIPVRRGVTTFGGRHLFQCADGRWISFVVMPYRWDDFVRWLEDEGIESPVRGEEWRDQAFRTQHPGAASTAIQELASRYRREEIFHEGQRRLISVMPVNDVKDLLEDAQLRDRGFFADFRHDESGRVLTDTGPAAGVGRGLRTRPGAPRLGEHNEAVYQGLLGMAPAELAALKAKRVI